MSETKPFSSYWFKTKKLAALTLICTIKTEKTVPKVEGTA